MACPSSPSFYFPSLISGWTCCSILNVSLLLVIFFLTFHGIYIFLLETESTRCRWFMHSCRKWEWARRERRGRRALHLKKISSNNIQLSRKCLSLRSLSFSLFPSSFPSCSFPPDFVLSANSWNFPVFYLFNVLSLDQEKVQICVTHQVLLLSIHFLRLLIQNHTQ